MPIGGTAYGRAKQRHNTLANLNLSNPIPAAGEFVAAIDGDDLVLRMGDGTTHWADLPDIYPGSGGGGGGGGPVGQRIMISPASVVINTAPAGQVAVFGNYGNTNLISGTTFAITQDADGFDFDAGWYTLQLKVWAGFTAGSDPLPDFVRLDLATWEGYEISYDLPCTPGSGNIGGMSSRSLHGVQAQVATIPYYTPGTGVTGGGENGHAVSLSWPGDATLHNGNNNTPQNNALSLTVTKLS